MAYKSATFPHVSSSQIQPREGGKGQQPSLVNPWYRIIRLNCYRMVDYFTFGFCVKHMLVLQLLQSNTILFARKIYSSKHLACMCYLSIFDLIRIRYIISIQIVLVQA